LIPFELHPQLIYGVKCAKISICNNFFQRIPLAQKKSETIL